jgi:hypothetical protein
MSFYFVPQPMNKRQTVNKITANKGVDEFGDRAISAIIKEYDRLDKKMRLNLDTSSHFL